MYECVQYNVTVLTRHVTSLSKCNNIILFKIFIVNCDITIRLVCCTVDLDKNYICTPYKLCVVSELKLFFHVEPNLFLTSTKLIVGKSDVGGPDQNYTEHDTLGLSTMVWVNFNFLVIVPEVRWINVRVCSPFFPHFSKFITFIISFNYFLEKKIVFTSIIILNII